MELGRRVFMERRKRGLSQAELARGSGVCQATLSRLETGHVKELRPTHLVGLADCLCMPTDYLLGRTDKVEAIDALPVDEAGRVLIDIYINLSSRSREQLVTFARFLKTENEMGDPDAAGQKESGHEG